MLTVVGKLLHLSAARTAYFGQKDAQQLLLIRRMVRDLDFLVDVVAVPTVREEDGLAMSSHHTYPHRVRPLVALCLSRALKRGRTPRHTVPRRSGVPPARCSSKTAGLVDYLVLVHPTTLSDVPEWYRGRPCFAVAARVGTTRLIDNTPVLVGPGGGRLDVFSPETTAASAPIR